MNKGVRYLAIRSSLFIALLGVLTSSAMGQTSNRKDGMRFVPDVQHAFYNFTEYPEPLGFHITTTPNPSTCRHYQGMARAHGADGTPFFLVTRSGNTPFPGEIFCDDS